MHVVIVVVMKSGVAGVVCSHVDKHTGVSVLKLIFNMYYKYFQADNLMRGGCSRFATGSQITDMKTCAWCTLVQATAALQTVTMR